MLAFFLGKIVIINTLAQFLKMKFKIQQTIKIYYYEFKHQTSFRSRFN
jgi:hypothetical protein